MREECPHCGHKLVSPSGRVDAPYLFIGEYPSDKDIVKGYPFSDDVGVILFQEMQYAGISNSHVAFTNFWLHGSNKSQECTDFCYERMVKMMVGRKGVLMMGSTLSEIFLGEKVQKWQGLEVDLGLNLPGFAGWVMMGPSPTTGLRQSIGEIRLTLQKFKKRMG
jgi:uracil-DNA glycosylase